MDYNNYYTTQSGQPPPNLNPNPSQQHGTGPQSMAPLHQHQQLQQSHQMHLHHQSPGPINQMMQIHSPHPNQHHRHQQPNNRQQQGMQHLQQAPHMQPQQQHLSYQSHQHQPQHQLQPSPLPHRPHSNSPHIHQQQHQLHQHHQQQQQSQHANLSGPPTPQPMLHQQHSTMQHSHSPHHIHTPQTPTMHLQPHQHQQPSPVPQQQDHMSRPSPVFSHPSTPGPIQPMQQPSPGYYSQQQQQQQQQQPMSQSSPMPMYNQSISHQHQHQGQTQQQQQQPALRQLQSSPHQQQLHQTHQYNQQQQPIQQQHHHVSQSQSTQPRVSPMNTQSDQIQQGYVNINNSNINKQTSHHPGILQTEVRLIELNKRLQNRPYPRQLQSPLPDASHDDSIWWERFASEFFDKDATLSIRIQEGDKPDEFSIGRTLIPRFFRSYFDGGVTDFSITIRNAKEVGGPNSTILDCDQAFIITNNVFKHPNIISSNPSNVFVHTEGHLMLNFVSNNSNPDALLIRTWKFYTRRCREFIDRSITSVKLPQAILAEPITRQGLTKSTIHYLKMCTIMEPMQDIMSHNRQTHLDPRSCLRSYLYERFKYKSVAEDKKVVAIKRRKRKDPSASGGLTPANKKSKTANNKSNNLNESTNSFNNNNSSINNSNSNSMVSPASTPGFSLATEAVMVVGEPTKMGGDFSDDNERMIARLENSQFDPSVSTISATSTEANGEALSSLGLEVSTSGHNFIPTGGGDATSVITETSMLDSMNQKRPVSLPNFADQVHDQIIEPASDPQQVSKVEKVDQATQLEVKIETSEMQSTQQELFVNTQNNHNNLNSDQPNSDPLCQITPIDKLDFNDDNTSTSTAMQSDSHSTIMNSIPEDREDNGRSSSCDLLVSKLPPNSKTNSLINGTGSKQNRRRSSERKETLREGLMRTSDFVVAMKDLKCEHPALWRITTGNNLLQQFEPKTQNGIVLYENTNQYAGWNPDIKRDYVGVDVKLTQHTRNQITVERLHLNFQNIEDAGVFYDRHFAIYLQILISTALDPKFWESIENEPKHHDYFLTSRRIIEDITKKFKLKLASKLKLSEVVMRNIEKYPNLSVKPIVENGEKTQLCWACNTNTCTQIITFGNRSYDLHSYKTVKVTSELSGDDENSQNQLCDSCLVIVKLYSEIHHMGWKFFNIARQKIEHHRTKSKPINAILDECLKDEDWLATIYAERDSLWSKIEDIQ